MNKPAAIAASLVDVRNIATHKVVRLELHVPAEQAGTVLAAFGWPTAVDPIPVAIARLVTDRTSTEPPKREDKPRTAWQDLPLPQQAALRCQDLDFRRFLRTEKSADINDGNDAAEFVRGYCDIGSRAELSVNDRAARAWAKIDSEYRSWLLTPMSAG
jgi:hypothetical protein